MNNRILPSGQNFTIHIVLVETVPVRTVNRQCSSGLQAVADVAAAIKAGFYDIGNFGILNMHASFVFFGCWMLLLLPPNRDWCWFGIHVNKFRCLGRTSKPKSKDYKITLESAIDIFYPLVFGNTFSLQLSAFQKAQDCLLPMGITSENVARKYGVTRQEQDQAAVSSLATNCFNSIASFFWLRWQSKLHFLLGRVSQKSCFSHSFWKIQGWDCPSPNKGKSIEILIPSAQLLPSTH